MDQFSMLMESSAASFVAFCGGWMGKLALIWCGLMVLDYVSGTFAATQAGDWSSEKARAGIWHKAGMIIVVTACALCDVVLGILINNSDITFSFSYSSMICPIALAWYIITEAGSVVENAALMGAPVPEWLLKFMRVAKITVDHAGERFSGGADDEPQTARNQDAWMDTENHFPLRQQTDRTEGSQ